MESRRVLLSSFWFFSSQSIWLSRQRKAYRIRTDKKAMRNSLIRFGKRASSDDAPLAQNGASLYESGDDSMQGPQLMLYPMFGYRQNLY
ncbi:hypothetical protein M3Y97_01096400 [Aphelenchoides bicaudatus]|nr:hypothetical protein M3Y97_01096400 [Aphelenchoides bicaudatus]